MFCIKMVIFRKPIVVLCQSWRVKPKAVTHKITPMNPLIAPIRTTEIPLFASHCQLTKESINRLPVKPPIRVIKGQFTLTGKALNVMA